MDSKLLAVFVVLLLARPAGGQVELRERVNDSARVMEAADKSRLSTMLDELERKTGAQLIVLTVASTDGRDPYDYASDIFRAAGRTRKGLGEKGKNNGVLVLVAVQDRTWRILVGEGLEGALPDLYCDEVAAQFFVPRFRRGQYSQGLLEGTSALAARVAAENGATLSGARQTPRARENRARRNGARGGCFGVLFAIFVVMMVLSSIAGRSRRRSYRRWGGGGFWDAMVIGSVLNSLSRGSGGRSGGSGWGGGGGFGGFGGGGGGSFGGGGAGGSW